MLRIRYVEGEISVKEGIDGMEVAVIGEDHVIKKFIGLTYEQWDDLRVICGDLNDVPYELNDRL